MSLYAGSFEALGQQIKAACIGGIFFLAGVPELVELLFKVPAGDIDTHVLMTLSCFGALAIGSALEVTLITFYPL